MSWISRLTPVDVPPEGGGRSDLPWQSNCRDTIDDDATNMWRAVQPALAVQPAMMMMCRCAAGGPTCPGRSNLPMMMSHTYV